MPASLGHQARFALDTSPTFDATSFRFEPISESLRKQTTVLDTNGLRGTRSHAKERTRFGLNQVGGQIVLNPSKIDLDNWLPHILGTAEAADVFAQAETLIEFWLLFDRVADIFVYNQCKVNKATFRGAPGELVTLTLDVIARSETDGQSWPGTVPALGTAASDAPYVFTDTSTLTLNALATAASVKTWELMIDNAVVPRFTNAVNATELLATDRIVTLACTVEWSSSAPDTRTLYDQVLAGAAGSLVLTNGTISTTFTLGNLQAEDRAPVIGSKGEIDLELFFTARKSGATAELSVTNEDAI